MSKLCHLTRFLVLFAAVWTALTHRPLATAAPQPGVDGETASNRTQNASPHAQACVKHVERVGDGNPHASCRWKQVSETLECRGGPCSVSHLESRTFGWSLGIGGGGSFGNAGFDVSESYTSGSSYTCSAAPNQAVCVTALVNYVDYTVRERVSAGECMAVHSEPYVIYAPDRMHQGLFRCHHGVHCHELDWEKWDHDGRMCEPNLPEDEE